MTLISINKVKVTFKTKFWAWWINCVPKQDKYLKMCLSKLSTRNSNPNVKLNSIRNLKQLSLLFKNLHLILLNQPHRPFKQVPNQAQAHCKTRLIQVCFKKGKEKKRRALLLKIYLTIALLRKKICWN